MVFWLSVLTTKFLTEYSQEKGAFLRETSTILQRYEDDTTGFFENFSLFPKNKDKIGIPWLSKEFADRNIRTSFVVIDSDSNIVFQNIFQQPNIWNISLDQIGNYYLEDDTMLRVLASQDSLYRFVFFQDVNYSISDFFKDILLLALLSAAFSFFFYILGYYFIGKVLKPVEENIEDMQAFSHNAGHELKTPLAVMRGNMQIMQAEKNFDTDLIKASISQIDRMNNLIESLRELSESSWNQEKKHLALSVSVKKIVDMYSHLAEQKNITIENNVFGPFIVDAVDSQLEILIGNILKNAILYTPEGGTVTLRWERNILSIEDTGKGMTQEEISKIFDRFYRADTVRSQEGFWIGLSLADKIAKINGWKIEVKSEVGKGSRFQIIF